MSGEVPEGWQVIPLSRLLSRSIFTDGDWIESKDQNPNGEVRLIQLADIGDGHFVDKSDRWMTSERAKQLRCTFLEHGDILVARMPDPIGRACSFPFDGEERYVTAVDVCIIRPDSSVDREWLKQALNAPFIRDQIISGATGTTRQRISRKNLGALDFPTPPLPEQQRIAEILSSVDESIRATEAVIAQAERVKRGLMEDLLTGGLGSAAIANGEIPEGWMVTSLKQISTKIGSGVTPKGGKKAYLSSGVPLIRSQNVGWGNLMLEEVAFIDEQQHEKMSGSKVKCGDVLLNITGASIGRSAVYFGDDFSANVNQHVCIIRPQADVDPTYINYFLLSHFGQSQVDAFQAGGNREGLNFQQIGSFRVSLPSLPEQRRIVAVLNSVNDQITSNRATVEQLQRLKRGMMDDLLTGKVRTVA